MSEELNLVTQLAIILIAAGVFTVISKSLKQPLILGYIVAGFIVGPHLGIFPQFSPESVHEWSELGIIFLMFGLGLEFSPKKLLAVGSSAAITAGTQCVGMFVIGLITGSFIGWTTIESIFLGGLMSMSSTTVIIKAYDDMGLMDKPYAPLIFGALVVMDLIAVLLMVLLSTLAVSNKFAGGEILLALGKLLFFLALCFLIGIYVIPTLLKKARNYLSDEILLLVSVGLCFLLVVLANLSGFSSALGAFLMGSILGSTVEGERIIRITGSIKNLFGAIFFISVGMMVDPVVISQHWLTILALTIVAMCGILLCSTAGVLLSGNNLDTAVHTGFTLAQLGEFSFIIAGLGLSLGVMRDFIYPVIIAVSVITTFTTPYMIKLGDPVSAWLYRVLPDNVLVRLNPAKKSPEISNLAEDNEWKSFLKLYFLRVGVYSLLNVAILLASKAYLGKVTGAIFPTWGTVARGIFECAVTIAVMSPFLLGLAVNGDSLKKSGQKLMKRDSMAKWPISACGMFRLFLAVMFTLAPVMGHFTLSGWMSILAIITIVVLFCIARKSSFRITFVEDKFIRNLNEKEDMEKKKAPVTTSLNQRLSGYDVHIRSAMVSPDFAYVGKTLREMPFRHTTGVNIVKIQRGTRSILVPSGSEPIFPGDILLAVGTNSQLDAFISVMNSNVIVQQPVEEEFVVEPILLAGDNSLVGQSLKDTDMRANGCMVISINHNGVFHTNPKPDYVFKQDDIVWLAGLKSSIEWYK